LLKYRRKEGRNMKKIILLGISMLMVFAMLFPMVFAFEYGNPAHPDNTDFETFGPRCDNLLIQLYASETAEWDALEADELDVTDWPLDAEHYTAYTTAPLNEKIRAISYGPEFGLFLFDLNNNNNEHLGNPPDPDYDNPVYPNPMSVVDLRRAIACLSDRTYVIDQVIGAGFAFPVYTPMSPASGFYVNPTIVPPNPLCYLLDFERALTYLFGSQVNISYYKIYANGTCINLEAECDVHVMNGTVRIASTGNLLTPCTTYTLSMGTMLKCESDAAIHVVNGKARFSTSCSKDKFPIGEDGWRYWDKNGNGIKDVGEDMSLKIFARSETPPRLKIAEKLKLYLETIVYIHVTWTPGDRAAALVQVMGNKNFHIYTAGWSLGMDPDHLILWHWDYYWHPGQCYNTVGANVPEYNDAADGVQYANTIEEATYYAHIAQEVYAEYAIGVPLWSAGGNKAVHRWYTGNTLPETGYHGRWWKNFVNIPGYGIDNGFTFMSMRPSEITPRAAGATIRYGFKTLSLNSMNPIYTNWLWDNTVIDLCGYDSLLYREPYSRMFKPWLCDSFTIGTWDSGTKTAINFTMRREAYWSDGMPITFDDINYTFVQMKYDLAAGGNPDPWWISNVQNIVEMIQYSPTRFEVRLDVKSVFAVGWIGGNRILPKHIWEPICKELPRPIDGAPWNPTTFAPDINIIHSGAWCFVNYAPGSTILLTAHKPGVTVTTSGITDPNWAASLPITSPKGFFRYLGKVVKFPEDYETLQGAVDAVSPGDTILVAPGVYHDQGVVVNKTITILGDGVYHGQGVVVNKTLTIIGLKVSDSVFDGGGSGQFCSLNASGTVVAGLVITNYAQGIVVNASNCRIYNNLMSFMSQNGIALMGAGTGSNQIYGNVFQNNQIAVNLTASSAGNVVHDNIVSTNVNVGINLESGGNIVCTNTISGNHLGIRVTASGNTIFHNNIVSNVVQTGIQAGAVNAWDDGYPSGGNYWSDYVGNDTKSGPNQDQSGSDGIGDTPYVIDADNSDRYPLMEPYSFRGDVNGDGKVNILDAILLSKAFNSKPGDANWNPDADFNYDGKVNILDAIILASNFGKSWP
jgi:parallel beta-helix repeat protein